MTEPLRPADPERLGPYRLTGRLGRGGMGTVYLGEDASGHPVAVKVINAELADDPAFHERFRREVTAARQVRRFSTAAVLDAQLDGEQLYVVTEFVDGPSLEQAVTDDGPMHGGALEGLAVGIATALGAIHGAGIVHRDLKPSNVLLSSTGPRVIDFGIARALDATDGPTRTGQFIGTPAYIAPELMRGEEVTPAADVFAWGCVVAYAGTGRAPFAGANVPEILYRVAHDPPVLDGLDGDLHAVVAATLEKDPRNRPTIQEVLARLVGATDPSPAQLAETVEAAWPARSAPERPVVPPPPPGPEPSTAAREVSPPTRAEMPTPPPPPGPSTASPPTHPAMPVPPTRVPRPRPRHPKKHLGYWLPGGLVPLAVFGLVWAFGDHEGGAGGNGGGPPAAVAPIVTKDTFDNPRSGWPDNRFVECGWYDGGVYTMQVVAGGDLESCRVPGQRAVGGGRHLYDVRLELESGPENGKWYAGLSLLGRGTGQNQYQVVLTPGGKVILRKMINGRLQELESDQADTFTKGDYNRLQVLLDLSKEETKIVAWVNGEQEIDHSDDEDPLRQGDSSLMVQRSYQEAGITPALVHFDDFSLSEAKG